MSGRRPWLRYTGVIGDLAYADQQSQQPGWQRHIPERYGRELRSAQFGERLRTHDMIFVTIKPDQVVAEDQVGVDFRDPPRQRGYDGLGLPVKLPIAKILLDHPRDAQDGRRLLGFATADGLERRVDRSFRIAAFAPSEQQQGHAGAGFGKTRKAAATMDGLVVGVRKDGQDILEAPGVAQRYRTIGDQQDRRHPEREGRGRNDQQSFQP